MHKGIRTIFQQQTWGNCVAVFSEEPELSEEAEDEFRRNRLLSKVKQLDETGLFYVELKRGERRIAREFYAENSVEFDDFVDAAFEKLHNPDDDLKHFRFVIEDTLHCRIQSCLAASDRPVLEPMSETIYDDLQWLWPGRIAADKLTLVVGDPGIGKSLFALDVAARVSSGQPWPDDTCEANPRDPGGVLLLAEIDDPADAIHPRLEAFGADLERIVLLRSIAKAGEKPAHVPFSIAGNLNMLGSCIPRIPDCRLVVIDPISLYLDAASSRHVVADLLAELTEIAVEFNVAVLMISHFKGSANPLFRNSTNTNFRAAATARAVWAIYADHEQANRRLMLPMKNNLGLDTHGLAFRIEPRDGFDAPSLVWENAPLEIAVEKTTFSGSIHALPNSYNRHRNFSAEWLKKQLIAGERLAQDILAAASLAKIGQRSLRRALREIGGVTHKGPGGQWVWVLNDQSTGEFCSNSRELIQLGAPEQACQVEQVDQVEQVEQHALNRDMIAQTCDLESEVILP